MPVSRDRGLCGVYELTILGGEGAVLLGCQTGVLDEPPPDSPSGDVRNEAGQKPTALGSFFESGSTHELMLTAGVYSVALSAGTYDETSMELTLRKP